jgi:hypothetical protein
MNVHEFTKIAALIRSAYPSSNIFPTKESLNTWFEMLNDLDFNICFGSVQMYIKDNEFPPSIASIRKCCSYEVKAFAKPWNEAWDSVMAAVKKYGTYGAIEAMQSLDELTRKSVKAIGFREICTSERGVSYLRHEFKDIYEGYKNEYDTRVQVGNNTIRLEDKREYVE